MSADERREVLRRAIDIRTRELLGDALPKGNGTPSRHQPGAWMPCCRIPRGDRHNARRVLVGF